MPLHFIPEMGGSLGHRVESVTMGRVDRARSLIGVEGQKPTKGERDGNPLMFVNSASL